MKLGIVGLPNVGKTTLFNALTHAGAAATAYAYTSAESNLGVVAVPDERLDRLHEVLETPKKVYATIDVVDIAGLAEGASRGRDSATASSLTSAASTRRRTWSARSLTQMSRTCATRRIRSPTSSSSRPSSC